MVIHRDQIPECRDYKTAWNWIAEGKYDYRDLPGRHTRCEVDQDRRIHVQYHERDIVIYLKDGRFIISSSNYKTLTTMRKINEYIPRPYEVRKMHHSKSWEVVNNDTGARCVFEDNMMICRFGDPEFDISAGAISVKTLQDWHELSNSYIASYVIALEAGELEHAVDIEYLEPGEEELAGKVKLVDKHIMESILLSNKFPPSLLRRALYFDLPDEIFFQIGEEMLSIPPMAWKSTPFNRKKAVAVFRRVLRRLIRLSIGLPV